QPPPLDIWIISRDAQGNVIPWPETKPDHMWFAVAHILRQIYGRCVGRRERRAKLHQVSWRPDGAGQGAVHRRRWRARPRRQEMCAGRLKRREGGRARGCSRSARTGRKQNPKVSNSNPKCQTSFELLAENPRLKTPGGFSFWRVGSSASRRAHVGKGRPAPPP